MTGIFPVSFYLEKRPQAHGYTVAEVTGRNPFYRKGVVIKGHEFHYSRPVVDFGGTGEIDFAFTMRRGQGVADHRDGLTYKNVFATYTHVHAYGTPEWADGLVRRAHSYGGLRRS